MTCPCFNGAYRTKDEEWLHKSPQTARFNVDIPTKYGSSFGVIFSGKGPGIWIMINGRMFSFFRGLNSGRWQFSRWDNIWRKSKRRIE